MSPALRRTLVAWHRWSALALAALLLVQTVSGLMIVFKDEAARILHRSAMKSAAASAQRIDADRALARAHAAAGDCVPERLYFPQHHDDVFLLRCRDASGAMRLATVDAASGQVLAAGPLWRFPFEAADLIHLDLTSGRIGRNLLAVLGFALTILAALGMAAWWPGRGRVRLALRVPWRGSARQKLVQLHRTAGALLTLAIMVTASSGAALGFYPALEQAVARWLPVTKVPGPEGGTAGGVLMSLAEVERRALELLPGGSVRDIRLSSGAPYRALVALNPASPARPRAADRLWIDRRDGTSVAALAANEPSGSRVLGWILPVHTGEALGIAGRWLAFAAGLGLFALVVSGCASWMMERARRRGPRQPVAG